MDETRKESPRRAVVLVSGGLDSATVLAMAREEGYECYALTVDYGQRHALEIERAAEIAGRLGAREHRTVRLDLGFVAGSALTDPSIPVPRSRTDEVIGTDVPVTYVPARNTVFLALALAWAESLVASAIFIGANAVDYSGYPDCRPEFLEAVDRLATLGTRLGLEGRGPRIRAPLLHMTKGEIVRRAVELGLELGRTLSCYAPSAAGVPCGTCDACRLRAKGFEEAGLADPALDGTDRRSESGPAGCPGSVRSADPAAKLLGELADPEQQ